MGESVIKEIDWMEYYMKTGESVTELGLYASLCCDEELIFDVGDILLRCPACQTLCSWELAEEVISYEELEYLPPRAGLWSELRHQVEDVS